jgi:hypothetical protein
MAQVRFRYTGSEISHKRGDLVVRKEKSHNPNVESVKVLGPNQDYR